MENTGKEPCKDWPENYSYFYRPALQNGFEPVSSIESTDRYRWVRQSSISGVSLYPCSKEELKKNCELCRRYTYTRRIYPEHHHGDRPSIGIPTQRGFLMQVINPEYLVDYQKYIKSLPIKIADFTEDNILDFVNFIFQLVRKERESPCIKPTDLRGELVKIRILEQLLEQAIPNYRSFVRRDFGGVFALNHQNQLVFIPSQAD